MLKSCLCDYSDTYILMKGTIIATGVGAEADAAATQAGERNNRLTFKNYARFIDYISEINNMQVDNAIDLDVVMPMHNLIEYSNNINITLYNC